MNYKKLIPLFIIFSFTFLFSQVYAVNECDSQTGPAGITWVGEDGSSCTCQETISIDENGSEIISYMGICAYLQGGAPTESVPPEPDMDRAPNTTRAGTIEPINSECSMQIKELNLKIQELNNPHTDYVKERLINIRQARQKVDNLFQAYKECRWKKFENNTRPNSTMTGRLVLVDPVSSTSTSQIVSVDSMISITMPVGAEDEKPINDSEILLIENIETENSDYMDSIQDRIDKELNDDLNLSEDCKEKLSLIKEQIEIIKQNIAELKKFREENKDTLVQLKELIAQRNEKLKDCFGIKEGNFDCKVPEELINRYKELDKQRNSLKETLVSSSEDTFTQSNQEEYRKVKEEYFAISQKIAAIKNDCVTRQNMTKVENICQEKTDILRKMDELKKEMETSTSDQANYELKTKLEYLNKKYLNVVCVQPITSQVVSGNKPEVQVQGTVSIDLCVNNLVEKAGIEEDVAKFACQKKFSQENQGYKDRLIELESKIQAQQQVINNLRSKIESIQDRITNSNPGEKDLFIQENAADIKNDTVAKIDKKIESLNKLIENIDNSEMIETTKTKQVDSINTKIANLDMLKTSILNSDTTDELKNYINDARIADNLANKEFIVSSLKKQTTELERIIITYLANNNEYNSLKSEIASLNSKISEINTESTNEEINSIKEEYNALKEKVKSLAKEVESK